MSYGKVQIKRVAEFVKREDSPATNPEGAVAPWEFPRSVMRHLENSKVEIGTLEIGALGKFRSAP